MSHVELREGSRVALLVPGSPDYLDLVMSLLAAGMAPIPLDPRLTPYERERILGPLEPDLVVEADAQLASMIENTPDRFRWGSPDAGRSTARAARRARRRASTAGC